MKVFPAEVTRTKMVILEDLDFEACTVLAIKNNDSLSIDNLSD